MQVKEAIKLRILGEVDGLLAPGAIIATNTSSISITRLAAATERTNQVVAQLRFLRQQHERAGSDR